MRKPRALRPQCFTLVETLMVLATIGVVLALSLPALSRARAAAALTRIHSTAGSVGAATQMYAADYVDRLPYLGVPGKPWEGVFIEGRRPEVSYLITDPPSYFSQGSLYANLLYEGYLADRVPLLFPAYAEQARADRDFMTPYYMTLGAFAAPAYWIGNDVPSPLSHYRAVALSEAAFPSSKGLILHGLSGVQADEHVLRLSR